MKVVTTRWVEVIKKIKKRKKIFLVWCHPLFLFFTWFGSGIREPGSGKGGNIRIWDPRTGINTRSRIHPARGMNPDPDRWFRRRIQKQRFQ
jgi:hypothetical protein